MGLTSRSVVVGILESIVQFYSMVRMSSPSFVLLCLLFLEGSRGPPGFISRRDPQLPSSNDDRYLFFDPPSDSQSTIIIADNDVERSNKDDETIHVKIWRALAGKNERHSKSWEMLVISSQDLNYI